MSIMTTRSNALESPSLNLANTMEERSLISGFNSSKNAYIKNSLNKTHKNNSSGPPHFQMSTMSGAMAEPRNLDNSSEMIHQKEPVEKTQLKGSKAHVPKLLLTQANVNFAAAFAKKPTPMQYDTVSPQLNEGKKSSNDDMNHFASLDTNANARTNADSQILNSQAFGMGSHEDSAMIRRVFDETRAAEEAERIMAQPDDGQTPLGFHNTLESPTKKYNPVMDFCTEEKEDTDQDTAEA